MSYTQSDLDALKAAYARGALELQMGSERIRYDSGEAMLRRIRVIEAELAAASGRGPQPMAIRTMFVRG